MQILYSSDNNGLETLGSIILLSIIAIGAAIKTFNRYFRNTDTPDTPILMGYYTEGADVLPIARGEVSNMRYSAFATLTKLTGEGSSNQPAFIMAIDLPFRTKLHLLGIPKLFDSAQINPTITSGIMETIDLEGDYGTYFAVYAEKGMQVEARYALDPKAMLFTIDFCKSYNWEIIKDTLYLVATGGGDPSDPTPITQDVGRFMDEIRPRIEDKNTPVEDKLRTPYGEDYRQDLSCPICNGSLVNKQTHMACPNNEGILINGKYLSQLSSGEITIIMPPKPNERPQQLVCPSCGKSMQHAAYNGSQVIIDTCASCTYRWLDAGELTKPFK